MPWPRAALQYKVISPGKKSKKRRPLLARESTSSHLSDHGLGFGHGYHSRMEVRDFSPAW
jgi:hypothetical protein